MLNKFDTVFYVLVIQGAMNKAQIWDGLNLTNVVLLLCLLFLFVIKIGFFNQEINKFTFIGCWLFCCLKRWLLDIVHEKHVLVERA